jgi:hypothetical protein
MRRVPFPDAAQFRSAHAWRIQKVAVERARLHTSRSVYYRIAISLALRVARVSSESIRRDAFDLFSSERREAGRKPSAEETADFLARLSPKELSAFSTVLTTLLWSFAEKQRRETEKDIETARKRNRNGEQN